ncbi:MAG: hypothetical protein J6386_14750 [Candidatus Synoicihabitans palmerolidicus]|nr:hypothetical protein [Candidatus Synoicihabitans palmerolidicus]
MLSPHFRRFLTLAAIGSILGASARAHDEDPVIHFPDLPNLLTLVCDFHQHTVFSDGAVWPDIRVKEGIRDGVDVMAVTDHLEYQPHREDIPHPDRNRSFDLALAAAKEDDTLVVRCAEVTRDMTSWSRQRDLPSRRQSSDPRRSARRHA